MKIAILSANLGSFDKPIEPIVQDKPKGVDEITYHLFTDQDFPPIVGLTPRLQYRIPKLFGYEMFPDYDYYIWLDGSMSLQRPDSVEWFLEQCSGAQAAFFSHPWRNSIQEEVNHIEDYLLKGNDYITSRYKGGLHKEMMEVINEDKAYSDDWLFTSTAFIYKNCEEVHDLMMFWWYYQSRYFTCDQVALPYAIHRSGIDCNIINENQFKISYLSLVSKHK